MDSPPTLPHATVTRARVTVALPAVRRGPVCARAGCRWTAWFSVHHVPVCSSACAQALADAPPAQAVVRSVRWQSWTLVVATRGRSHHRLQAWWWRAGVRQAGRRETARTRRMDIATDAGLFQFLRYLVRKGATELRPWRIAGWAWERGEVDTPPWVDVALPQEPTSLAHAIVRVTRSRVRARERARALRGRYRQRGVSQESTTAQASRVA